MKISEILKEFIKKENISGSTDSTIRHYKTHIGFFIKYFGDKDINNITYEVYEDYIVYLRNKYKESSGFKGKKQKLAGRTIKTYASALKTFLTFAHEKGYLKEDISKNIKMPKYKKKVIEILNKKEIDILLNSFDKRTFLGARDYLIVSLMLDCGLRLSEVIKLKLEDINSINNLIKVDGKGQKERFVPLTPAIAESVKLYKYQYFLTFGKVLVNSEQLIKNINGEDATKNTISLLFRRLRKTLKIHIHPHLLRHTFATMFLMNGGDITNLKIILGHTTLNMVLNYLHLANEMNMINQIQYTPLTNIQNMYSHKKTS